MKMNLRFPESEIGYWVRQYKNEQTRAECTEELQLIELKPKIQECGC